jgi:acyl-coenzyme A synthetase/AMP-(fatty) acid ligase
VLTGRIFHWADRTPERNALTWDGLTLTYTDFARAIARARGFFVRRGREGPGVAAVALSGFLDFWVISLALRSLGFTTITLNEAGDIGAPHFPPLSLVATPPGAGEPWVSRECARTGIRCDVVDLDAAAALELGAGPDPAAGGHILQTSGTTGVRKMVLIDPGFEAEFLARRRRVNGINAGSIVSVFNFHPRTGVGYKSPAGTWDIGGWVVFDSSNAPHRSLAQPGLSLATMVPTMLRELLAMPQGAYPYNPNLMLAVTGGAITQSEIDQAKTRLTPRLYNGLGATECHPIALTPLDTPDDHRWHVPAVGTRIEIVDDQGRPAATGETGLLRVGTEGGPQGYLNDEAATKAFFRDRFFYPGDLAIRRADGRIALQGRATDVINIGGDKISPAPIEERLRERLGVGGVCVLTMQDAAGEERMYVLIETPTAIPVDRLAPALQAELFGFPNARVRFVHALPRNAMGKVVRRAVRDLVAEC